MSDLKGSSVVDLTYTEEYKKVILSSVEKAERLITSQELATERSMKLQLRDEIERIISASKLEDHPEVAIMSEHMKAIVEALISGSLLLNDNIRMVLKQALKDFEEALIQNKHYHQINQTLIEQLKDVARSTKHDEQDFVFRRKLKVLYVDSDEFAQMNVKRNAGKTVDITSCLSARDARALFKGRGEEEEKRFDAMLCELRLSDANGFDLVQELSSKLPVIAISTADDPKIIQSAVKAGAIDYIVKNDSGVRRIPRSLHTATNEWSKRRRSSAAATTTKGQKADTALDNPYARQLLQYMLQNPKPIRQQIEPVLTVDLQTSHPPSSSDQYLKGITKKEEELFDLLENEGYLVKNHVALTVSCPACKSTRITNRYQCPSCRSNNFVRGDVLEHSKCGYTGLEASFSSSSSDDDNEDKKEEGEMICPKCRKQLKLIGVDYFRIESAYKCKDCNNIFTSLDQRLSCMQCGYSNFKLSQSSWQSLYEYRINDKRIDKLKRALIQLEKLQKVLINYGFKVNTNYNIETKYGSFGPFDIVAKRENENIIFVITLTADMTENFSKMLDLDNATKLANGNISKFAIVFSEVNEVMRNMLKKFEIIPIFGENEESLVRDFRTILSERLS